MTPTLAPSRKCLDARVETLGFAAALALKEQRRAEGHLGPVARQLAALPCERRATAMPDFIALQARARQRQREALDLAHPAERVLEALNADLALTSTGA